MKQESVEFEPKLSVGNFRQKSWSDIYDGICPKPPTDLLRQNIPAKKFV